MVLPPGLSLDTADDIDREGSDELHCPRDVLGCQAAGKDHRHLRAPLCDEIPVEALAGTAVDPMPVGVEEVEVGPERLGRLDVGGARDSHCLYFFGSGSAP